ncbi:hypothetical protein HY988_01335 [Candidatus Micrarchaeota archaeon]|nr:hypothetical protein [Candidatus Micrarchaeota archaeon]
MATVQVSRAVNESRSVSQRSEASQYRFRQFQVFSLIQPTNPDEGTGPKPLWTPERGVPQRPGRDEVPEPFRNPWTPGKHVPDIKRRHVEDQPTIRAPSPAQDQPPSQLD